MKKQIPHLAVLGAITFGAMISFLPPAWAAQDETEEREGPFIMLNLEDKFTHKMTDLFSNAPGNYLTIPPGVGRLEGIKFQIGEEVIQLGSQAWPEMPEKVEGIEVGEKFSSMYLLHATGYGGGPNVPGTAWHIRDGALIGHYQVNYEDGAAETIPIVYGKDVRDWWFRPNEPPPSDAVVAWTGENERARTFNCEARLYLSTWHNPKPDVKVLTIDYVGRKDETVGAPFCVAITLDRGS